MNKDLVKQLNKLLGAATSDRVKVFSVSSVLYAEYVSAAARGDFRTIMFVSKAMSEFRTLAEMVMASGDAETKMLFEKFKF